MIPALTPSLPGAASIAAVAAIGELPTGVEAADFGALLAISTQTAEMAGSEGGCSKVQQFVLPETAAAAAQAATTGKTLPHGLPIELPPSQPEASAQPVDPAPIAMPQPRPDTAAAVPPERPIEALVPGTGTDQAIEPQVAIEFPVRSDKVKFKSGRHFQDHPGRVARQPNTETAADSTPPTNPAKPLVEAIEIPNAASLAHVPNSHPDAGQLAMAPRPEADQTAPAVTKPERPVLQIPALPQQASPVARTAPGRPERLGAIRPVVRQASSEQANPPAQPKSAPVPLSKVRLEVVRSEPPQISRSDAQRVPVSLASLVSEKSDPAPGPLLPIASPLAASAQQVEAAPLPPLAKPHDFAALIDRLAIAREAAQPQAVSVSLPHAEFGRVQLHFRSDDGALAVSLASSDPDFSRIAAQAAPPVLPVGDARNLDNNANQSGPRGDGPGTHASQQGSARGQSQDRRNDGQARFEHQPRSRAATDKDEGRSGIFA